MELSQTSPGNILRLAREKKGLSIQEAADHLHLTARQVKALEEDDHSLWPSLTYVHGYLRNYAHLLGIDAEEILRASNTPHAPSLEQKTVLERTNLWLPYERKSWKKLMWIMIFVGFFGLLVFVITPLIAHLLPANHNPDTASSSAVIAEKPSVAMPEPAAPPALQAPDTAKEKAEEPLAFFPEESAFLEPHFVARNLLIIRATGDCWVGIYDQAGKMIFNKVVHPGEEVPLTIAKPFTVKLGRVDAVTLSYAGNPIDLSAYRKKQTASVQIKD
jgi:cytoskeleton protein RodZ